MAAETVILTLKIAVIAVTALFLGSLTALWRGRYVLHGRINTLFFVLTLLALLGLEVVARILSPDMFSAFLDAHHAWPAMYTHLSFSLPAAAVLPFMLWTGRSHRRKIHIALGIVFAVLWTGTFITGVFFLPHASPMP